MDSNSTQLIAILNRIGNFAGTGLNTVKGFFQAMFRKDAGVTAGNTPSEINEIENGITGNYDGATESSEAIRDRGDVEWITATGFNTTTPPTVGEIQAEMEEDGASILDTLRDRLTAVRAGYLDELGPTNIPADIDTLLTRITALIATKAQMDAAHALLATSVALATVDGIVDDILVDTNVTIPALIAALNDLSAVEVNAEVVDVLSTDTQSMPGQGALPLNPTTVQAIMILYKFLRNKEDNDGSTIQKYDAAGLVVDHKATAADVGGTSTRGKWETGP